MKLYRIAKWADSFENSRSRQIIKTQWVAVPNRHDGEYYTKIVTHPDGAMIYAGWQLIIQVASKCHPRGTLVKDNGTPHTPESLSLKTRAPAKWFDVALVFLESHTDWLEVQILEDGCQEGIRMVSGNQQEGDIGRKGGNEGREGTPLPVELPYGFPKTQQEAEVHADFIGCPKSFAATVWNKAASRGGADSKGVLIRSFRHHLQTDWSYAQERKQKAANKPGRIAV